MAILYTKMRKGGFRAECGCGWWHDAKTRMGAKRHGEEHKKVCPRLHK